MKKKRSLVLLVSLIVFTSCPTTVAATLKARISIFNFEAVNLDASGYGATVTNLLVDALKGVPSLTILDRRELETFLSLNDLQQNDDMENVLAIGTRLGLDVVVVGSLRKSGPVISINCKAIHVAQKRTILNINVESLGDAGLRPETKKLSRFITTAIFTNLGKVVEDRPLKGPANVRTRPGNTRIGLRWEDPPGTTASGYKIFRSLSESGPFAMIAQVTQPEYLDQGLERKTTYYYRIRAYDSKGRQSDFSSIVSAETAPTPNPPIIIKAESHIKSIRITWSPSPASSGDPFKLKGYKLYRARVERGPYKEVASILGKGLGDKLFKVKYTDRNLADGQDYYYKVIAYNERGLQSDFSTPAKATTMPIVTGVSARGNMIRRIELTCNPLDSPYVKGYYVYRSTEESKGFTKIKKIIWGRSKERLHFVDTNGLGDLTRYYYHITAFEDSDIETSRSETVSAITKGKPPVPEDLKAESGLAKKARLTWTANPQEEVKGYKAYRSGNSDGEYVPIGKIRGRTKTGFVDKGAEGKLEDNTTYYYRLTSYNKVDVESLLSEVVSATTKPRPNRPNGLKGEGLRVKEVPLAWEANPEKDIVCYHIYRSSDAKGDFSRIAGVKGQTNHLDKGLKDGSQYHYKLQAEDKDGLLSDFSKVITVQTKPRPGSPEGLSGTFREGKVELTWNPNSEQDIIYYNIYKKAFWGMKKIAKVKEPKFSDVGLKPGKKTTYAVTAADRDGLESKYSKQITIVSE